MPEQAASTGAIAAWMTPPSVAAAFLGGYFGGRVPETLLLAGIAAALLWNGVQLLFELGAPPRARSPRLAAVVAGAVIGLIGGAVGLILGTLRMPALLGRVGLPAARAVGTNLVSGSFSGSRASRVTPCAWRSTGRCSPSVWPRLFREPGSAHG